MAEDEEEECENLPSHLLPRKRGVEETEEGEGAGDQDVGAEGDDEESGSQPSVGYSQTIIGELAARSFHDTLSDCT